jgi:hypothetical protein
MNLFLKAMGSEDKEAPSVPKLQLSLKFNDIAGQRHTVSYDVEFHWYAVTPHTFEAELIPKRSTALLRSWS